MNTRIRLLSAAITTVCGAVPLQTYASLDSNATLNFDAGVIVCNAGVGTPPDNCDFGTNVPTGTYFSMDTNGNGTVQNGEKTALTQLNGIALGTAQAASGSHSGAPDGSETPNIDQPWDFFGNTGMHQTTGGGLTIISDDGAGNVSLDFSNWSVTWNGIPSIPLGGDAANFGTYAGPNGTTGNSGIALMTCGNTCENGDTYTLTYAAQVPKDDPSNFGNVKYVLNMVGTIVVPNDPPVASSFTTSGVANQPLDIDLAANTTDADGNLDVTTVAITSSDACTTITDNDDGTVTFPSCTDGNYSFDYTFDDTQGATSNTATVTVNLSADPAPNTAADSATTDGTTAVQIDVLANDTDNSALNNSSVATSTPMNGTITTIDAGTGAVTYQANAGFSGTDSFTYTVEDDAMQPSAATTVTVTVNALNSPSSNSTFVIGDTATSAGATDGIVTTTDIGVTDNGSTPEQGIAGTCIGGCFDFVLSGFGGTEAQVVLPLSTPIPSLSASTNQYKYRKLDSSGAWQDFDASGNDAIHTAPGTSGGSGIVCPQASDAVYGTSPNLTIGHQCVRLTLVDGGPNDADDTLDGSISDPGGIAETFSIDTRTSFTSGCSISNNDRSLLQHMEWVLLAGFMALFAWKRRHRES